MRLNEKIYMFFMILQVSGDEVYDLLSSGREEGPIIIYHASKERNQSSSSVPSTTTTTTEKPLVNVVAEVLLEDTSALLLHSILKKEGEGEGEGAPAKKPLNIFQKKPMFTNEYGSTSVADETDSELLKHANKGVFSVKLEPVSGSSSSSSNNYWVMVENARHFIKHASWKCLESLNEIYNKQLLFTLTQCIMKRVLESFNDCILRNYDRTKK